MPESQPRGPSLQPPHNPSPPVLQVGATINCGRAYDIPPTVHVQSYVSATDAAGLGVLLSTQRVFRCWGHIHETIVESELGASRAIMKEGYTIDSLMLRYQVGAWGKGGQPSVLCARFTAAPQSACQAQPAAAAARGRNPAEPVMLLLRRRAWTGEIPLSRGRRATANSTRCRCVRCVCCVPRDACRARASCASGRLQALCKHLGSGSRQHPALYA